MPEFREEMAWAAGLFEGEGCFTGCHPKPGRRYFQARAQMNMVDPEPLRRFMRAVGGVGRIVPKKSKNQPQLSWYASSFAEVQAVIAMLWPWLSARRRKRASEILLLGRATHA